MHNLDKDTFKQVVSTACQIGSFKLALDQTLSHSVEDVNTLFEDYDVATFQNGDAPEYVDSFYKDCHLIPFNRIKTINVDPSDEIFRSRGYVAGSKKLEDATKVLKRVTAPQTIYTKQTIHRDDILDSVNMDLIKFVKGSMRIKLLQEIVEAALIGDRRVTGALDKIYDDSIRPVYKDDPLFTIARTIPYEPTDMKTNCQKFVRTVVKSRSKYRGSRYPILFMSDSFLAECLTVEDTTGRFLYTKDHLCHMFRVRDIIGCKFMDDVVTQTDKGSNKLLAIMVSPEDYCLAFPKKGKTFLFTDFDIDFNDNKYLLETRVAGALVSPFSAMSFEGFTGHPPKT